MLLVETVKELTQRQKGISLVAGMTIALLVLFPTVYMDFGFETALIVLLALGSVLVSAAGYLGLLAKIRNMVRR